MVIWFSCEKECAQDENDSLEWDFKLPFPAENLLLMAVKYSVFCLALVSLF